MDSNNTRIGAVRALLNDENARRLREKWESLLADNTFTPEA